MPVWLREKGGRGRGRPDSPGITPQPRPGAVVVQSPVSGGESSGGVREEGRYLVFGRGAITGQPPVPQPRPGVVSLAEPGEGGQLCPEILEGSELERVSGGEEQRSGSIGNVEEWTEEDQDREVPSMGVSMWESDSNTTISHVPSADLPIDEFEEECQQAVRELDEHLAEEERRSQETLKTLRQKQEEEIMKICRSVIHKEDFVSPRDVSPPPRPITPPGPPERREPVAAHPSVGAIPKTSETLVLKGCSQAAALSPEGAAVPSSSVGRTSSGRPPLKIKTKGVLFGNLTPIPTDPSIDPPPGVCFNCWRRGHLRIRCPSPQWGDFCMNCGRRRVRVNRCPRCEIAYMRYQYERDVERRGHRSSSSREEEEECRSVRGGGRAQNFEGREPQGRVSEGREEASAVESPPVGEDPPERQPGLLGEIEQLNWMLRNSPQHIRDEAIAQLLEDRRRREGEHGWPPQ